MRSRSIIHGFILLGIGVATGYWMGTRNREASAQIEVVASSGSKPTLTAPSTGNDLDASRPPIRTAVQASETSTISEKTKPSRPQTVRAVDIERPNSRELSASWRSDIQQIQDLGTRTRALAELREALGGTDRTRRLAALSTLRLIIGVEYDKSSFHKLVEGHLQSADAETKRAAIEAFCATGGPQSDAGPLLSLVSDPDPTMRSAIARSILMLTRETSDTKVEKIYADLLKDADERVVSDTLQALRQIQMTEPVEDRLMELAKNPSLEADVCSSLAWQENKSDRVVDFLVRAATSSDSESIQAAVRGLSNGLRDDQRDRAIDEVVRSMGSATNLTGRWSCFQLIEQFGSQRHIPTLRDVASNPMLDERSRSYIERIITGLEKK
jgi:hypothetical protein